jgi:glucosamine--fructose-6-phosphate aminotransferase (isomerizing)
MSDMLREIEYLPELIIDQIPLLDEQVKHVFDHRRITSFKEIIFTGCGDSYFAGIGVRHFFQRVCNIPARAIPSMDAARYDLIDYKSSFPYNPLVIATSVSGMVVRTVEAITIAKSQGASTLALVGNNNSPLAEATDKIIHCKLKELPRSPGVASYRVSLLAMYLLGIHFAEVRRRISKKDGNKLRDSLKRTSDQINITIKNNKSKANDLSELLKETNYFTFIGDGPNFSSAVFSAAKITEGTGLIAVSQNTEEWAHLQYFENAYPQIPTFIITSGGRGYNRILELLTVMKRIGRYVIAVSSEECSELISNANFYFSVKKGVSDLFSPIVYPVANELFASYLSDAINAEYYRENLDTYPRYANTIRDNELLTKEHILKHG